MTERHLLHASKVDAFAAWAASRGYTREATKGSTEKLRLRRAGEPPLIYHQRDRQTVHLSIPTAPRAAYELVREWLNMRGDPSP